MGLSVSEYHEVRAKKLAREARSPSVSDIAPDLEVERLSLDRSRTGEMFRLSATRGKPVGLIFGSYT